ncbi:glc operon protein GlcG [Polymorphobacter multimanifer]|uniref:Glc operon protein GlcG n=1 Tax=Polymorphobacter multimanifer TaxID=1070431 RepID=A0A841L635_9SPHN|nr:heme-binding protein [Polymorphobacter multimanifer]MBB6226981.1 glc operon protein GlcG [Polymorphobacter multimanifer]
MRAAPIAAAVVAALLLAAPAAAQMVVQKPVLTLAGARAVLAAAEAKAVAMGLKVSVVVVDPAGVPIVSARMDDASMVGPEIALAKAKTAAGFRQPTKVMQQRLLEPEGLRMLTLPGTMVDGAVPVKAGAAVVGAVGVSGASSAQDGEIAEAGATAVR